MPQAYSLVNVGTAASGTGATPGNPASIVAGRLLAWASVGRLNSDTFTAPSGWTDVSPHVNVPFCSLWLRIATATSGDNAVAIATLPTGSQIATQIAQFSGDIWQGGLGSIVDASQDKTTPASNGILYDQFNAPPTAADLVLAIGGHNKTATTNGATVTTLAGTTDIGSLTPTGTGIVLWWGYQQQTTAAIIASGGATQALSINESLQYASMFVALKTQPAAGGGAGSRSDSLSRRRRA